MKRTILTLTLVAVLAATGSALAGGHHGALVKSHATKVGTILVNRRGYTLYVFAPDKRNKDVCATPKYSGCLNVWPAVKTNGKPVAGSGVKASLLGSIKFSGGRQVTYDGRPLYTFRGDTMPAQTSYIGINNSGGRWWAITPTGKLIKKP